MAGHIRVALRVAFGLLLVLHGLAHAVLPLRGIAVFPPEQLWVSPFVPLQSAVLVSAYSVALVSLVAGGLGILGSRIFGRYATPLVGFGLTSSLLALLAGWSDASWWGLALDSLLAGGLIAARNTRLAAAFTKVASGARWPLRRIIAEAAALGAVLYMAAATALWPWHRTWGTTEVERVMRLPGDAVIRDPAHELMHAVTIDAPPEAVWPWLAQIGQDRAGFYSYDWLERLFFADVHNANELRPEWQHRASGEFVRATQPGYLGGLFGANVGWRISQLDPPTAMVLENWGAFVLQPTADGRTRLLIRSAMGGPDVPVWGAGLTFALFELPHFIMQRKMMLGIKERAERSQRGGSAAGRRTRVGAACGDHRCDQGLRRQFSGRCPFIAGESPCQALIGEQKTTKIIAMDGCRAAYGLGPTRSPVSLAQAAWARCIEPMTRI